MLLSEYRNANHLHDISINNNKKCIERYNDNNQEERNFVFVSLVDGEYSIATDTSVVTLYTITNVVSASILLSKHNLILKGTCI